MNHSKSSSGLSIIAALGMLIAFGNLMLGQNAPLQQQASATKPAPALNEVLRQNIEDWIRQGWGIADDWSHHHVVFSNPGTEDEAFAKGTHDQWLNLVNDPRYILQQMKRDPAARNFAPGTTGVDDAEKVLSRTQHSELKRDWSMDLGSGAKVGADRYPAKYSFNPVGTPNCATDYAAFNTGIAGGASQPTIIAYNNLYAGASPGCGTTGVPTIYWQYNTAYPQGSTTGDGSTIVTSVVLASNGSQLAFVESNSSSVASLVILKWAASSSLVQMDTATNNVTAANYRSCTASCMTRIAFGDSHNDTNSSPFYDYIHDVLYVGDASGVLHKFQNIFVSGTPGEVTTGGWPVAASTTALTSPVYDSGSTLVLVGDASGYLYSVNSSGAVIKSYQMAVSPGIIDGPLVDSAAEQVYVFVGNEVNGSNSSSPCGSGSAQSCSGVFQLPIPFTATTNLSESVVGVSDTTNDMYTGAFDNIYYASSDPPTGSLYACGYNLSGFPRLAEVPISSGAIAKPTFGYGSANQFSLTHGTAYDAEVVATFTDAAATCSPVTEFDDSGTDRIFLSVTAGANYTEGTSCTGACLYSFTVTTEISSPNPNVAASKAVTGGTSGLIIDNGATTTGAAQIYFSPLANESCAGNGTTGSGTGGCAVQASQSALQ